MEFRQADSTREVRSLQAFDRKIFSKSDRFPAAYWRECESWWLLVDGVKAGCCAFEKHRGFEDGEGEDGTLYIATTGILPAHQRRGFGTLMKSWEVAYARSHGFRRIVTNMRKSNAAMIALNRQFGFRAVRTVREYYVDPVEATVVMTLMLPEN